MLWRMLYSNRSDPDGKVWAEARKESPGSRRDNTSIEQQSLFITKQVFGAYLYKNSETFAKFGKNFRATMILSTTYDEITRLVREKSGQQIGIRYKDVDTLTLSYNATIPIPILNRPLTHQISADVQVAEFAPPRVVLQLNAGAAGNLALDMASQKLLSKLPEGLVESFSGGRATLNLEAVPQLKALFERLRLERLVFYDSSLSLEGELK